MQNVTMLPLIHPKDGDRELRDSPRKKMPTAEMSENTKRSRMYPYCSQAGRGSEGASRSGARRENVITATLSVGRCCALP
jgi:hypothetical protein